MKRTTLIVILAGIGSLAHAKPQIAPPPSRAAAIANVNQALQPRKFSYAIDSVKRINPFAPIVESEEPAPVVSNRPVSGRDFTEMLAAQLNPTGVLVLGDTAYLLFGEKRAKPGDPLLVSYEKENYQLELVSLTRTTFTVRYQQVEVTRSIKPAKQP
jgi:hypothetical protein